MKRPTQVDVARLAGVSRATVSYVVNGLADGQVPISEETRQRVLEAIEELGYEPDARAQALRSGSTQTVGLILPDIHNPHFWQTADGVEQELRAAGYHLLLSSADLNPDYGKDIFKAMSRRRTDGLILMSAFIFHNELGGVFAMGIVALIPVFALFILFQKHLVKSISWKGSVQWDSKDENEENRWRYGSPVFVVLKLRGWC
jgi:transcriptional regulator with XRE-family HTH domain